MLSSGVLHTYTPGLVAFEHLPSTPSENKILFIAGLGDGLSTVPIVQHLQHIPSWDVIELLLSSSYKGWGTSSVQKDAEEIAAAVSYFRKTYPSSKLVLLGHSTGSQDLMQYLLNLSSGLAPSIDGAIMQAPVSDREGLVQSINKTSYLTSLSFAEDYVRSGKGSEIIPEAMRPGSEDTPISAERWWSLNAPLDADGKPQGKEDFFSTDIGMEVLKTTFGRLPKDVPVLALMSGEDEFVAREVDKEGLILRWKEAAGEGNFDGEVVAGAGHNVSGGEKEVEEFRERVGRFLGKVLGDNV